MKKIFIVFAFLLSAFYAFADGLSANDVTFKNEDTATLSFSLSNATENVVGLQFNLILPTGITPVMDGANVVVTPSDRLKGSYLLRGSRVANGSYLFTFLSNERIPINGNSGTLFSITLQNSNLADGGYMAYIDNTTLTDLGGNERLQGQIQVPIKVVHNYKLTYKVDGNVYKEYSLAFGAAITPEAEPTREGYTFSGWSEIPQTMPAHDVTVNGSFTINKYKVTFISDGTVIKEDMLEYGAAITAPANPTKVGHTFTGWNPAVDATVPAHDVTYTAQFAANQYTITFDTDGGSAVAPITLSYGAAITKPMDPVKQGYTFAGWNPSIPETMPAENMTIKALWTVNSYKLTYKVDGNVHKEYSLNFGAAITPEAEPTREGYTFSGWSEIPATMPAHDVTVNGSFTINKYKVTFISDGIVIKEDMLEYGAAITAPANPTKVGHTFTGWNPAVDATVPAHDVTYTAQFAANQYTITFDTDGGSAVAPITQSYGTAITKPADPVKQGYTFAGWNPAIPETMPAENMTIKALWTVNSYKLTYKVDGNVYKEYSLAFGATITPEVEPTKEGYTFSGWSEIPQTMPAHDVVVTGSFTKGAYKLTYYVDGAKYKEVSYDYGDAITPEAEPTREGYTFSGWSEIPATMPAHDVTVTGSFTINKYKVTFISDGTVIKEDMLEYGAEIVLPDDPEKEGHTFVGWNPEVPQIVPAMDLTFEAMYTVNYYKVSYFVEETLVHEDEVAYGETFELWSFVPEDDDLTFNGWMGERYETMPAHDISYTADITSGIVNIYSHSEDVEGIYTLDGKKVETIHHGIYMVRMMDGTSRKLMVK